MGETTIVPGDGDAGSAETVVDEKPIPDMVQYADRLHHPDYNRPGHGFGGITSMGRLVLDVLSGRADPKSLDGTPWQVLGKTVVARGNFQG